MTRSGDTGPARWPWSIGNGCRSREGQGRGAGGLSGVPRGWQRFPRVVTGVLASRIERGLTPQRRLNEETQESPGVEPLQESRAFADLPS